MLEQDAGTGDLDTACSDVERSHCATTAFHYTASDRFRQVMHSLHDPDRLFRTRSGYVFLCDCCGRLQIVVRNHTLLLYEDDLEPLTNTVKRALKKMQDAADDETWEFKIQTEAGPVSMVLTESSLRSVRNLLQGAWSMYRLRTRTSAVASGEGTAHNVLRDHVAGKSTEEAIFI